MEKKAVLFRTSDLYFSAYLCALDLPLLTTEQETVNGRVKLVFLFNVPEENLARLRALYFGGAGQVPARRFVDSMRSLKEMTHAI